MRKIILLMHVSLDGFAAASDGAINWITFDADLEQYVHTLHATMDAAVYGRMTYRGMESYWPTVLTNPASTPSERAHAQWLDSATKIVFSRTLDTVEWKNSLLFHGNIAEEMTKIKQQPGKDIFLVGSLSVAQTLMRHSLIDQFWLNVNPVVLGSGRPLFAGLDTPLHLKLVNERTFKCGVVGLQYELDRK